MDLTEEPWTPDLIAYGTPGEMFLGVIDAIQEHWDSYSRSSSVVMSSATRAALVREFFPNHSVPAWAEGDMVYGTPITLDESIPFGEFRPSESRRG